MKYRKIGKIGDRKVYMFLRQSPTPWGIASTLMVLIVDGREYAKDGFDVDGSLHTWDMVRERAMSLAREMNEKWDSMKEIEYNISFIQLEE